MPKGIKKERAIAARERQRHKEERVQAQQAQQAEEQARLESESSALWKHRLDSDEAYAKFEAFYRQRVNTLHYLKSQNPELSLTLDRYYDGKPLNQEVILKALEQERIINSRLLLIAKQLAMKEQWNASQLERLQDVLIKHLSFHRWHKRIRPMARLARVITDAAFEAQLHSLKEGSGAPAEMAARLLVQIEQEKSMHGKPRIL